MGNNLERYSSNMDKVRQEAPWIVNIHKESEFFNEVAYPLDFLGKKIWNIQAINANLMRYVYKAHM